MYNSNTLSPSEAVSVNKGKTGEKQVNVQESAAYKFALEIFRDYYKQRVVNSLKNGITTSFFSKRFTLMNILSEKALILLVLHGLKLQDLGLVTLALSNLTFSEKVIQTMTWLPLEFCLTSEVVREVTQVASRIINLRLLRGDPLKIIDLFQRLSASHDYSGSGPCNDVTYEEIEGTQLFCELMESFMDLLSKKILNALEKSIMVSKYSGKFTLQTMLPPKTLFFIFLEGLNTWDCSLCIPAAENFSKILALEEFLAEDLKLSLLSENNFKSEQFTNAVDYFRILQDSHMVNITTDLRCVFTGIPRNLILLQMRSSKKKILKNLVIESFDATGVSSTTHIPNDESDDELNLDRENYLIIINEKYSIASYEPSDDSDEKTGLSDSELDDTSKLSRENQIEIMKIEIKDIVKHKVKALAQPVLNILEHTTSLRELLSIKKLLNYMKRKRLGRCSLYSLPQAKCAQKSSRLHGAKQRGNNTVNKQGRGRHSSNNKKLLGSQQRRNNAKSRRGRSPFHRKKGSEASSTEKTVQSMHKYKFRSGIKRSILHFAVLYGYFKAIVNLLTKPSTDVNCVDGEGNTALHVAIKMRRTLPYIRTLTELGKADVNFPDNNGRTALHLSAIMGCELTSEYLIRQGADLHKKDLFGKTPVDYFNWKKIKKKHPELFFI